MYYFRLRYPYFSNPPKNKIQVKAFLSSQLLSHKSRRVWLLGYFKIWRTKSKLKLQRTSFLFLNCLGKLHTPLAKLIKQWFDILIQSLTVRKKKGNYKHSFYFNYFYYFYIESLLLFPSKFYHTLFY